MRKARSKSGDRPAAKNIEAIATLEREALHDRSRLDRITDHITATAGSPTFVVVHACGFSRQADKRAHLRSAGKSAGRAGTDGRYFKCCTHSVVVRVSM